MDTDDTQKQTAENGPDRRDDSGRFTPGNPGGPGRPKGEPNKVNALLKEDILQAYQERGGIDWLRGLSDRLFTRLLEKTMPKEIAANVRATIGAPWETDAGGMSDEAIQGFIARAVAEMDGTNPGQAIRDGDLEPVTDSAQGQGEQSGR